MLLSLADRQGGEFVFDINDKAYSSLKSKISGGWSRTDRAGNKPLWQATQKPVESISIAGSYVATYKGSSTEQALRGLIDLQEPLFMIGGDGKYLGEVVIVSVDFNKTLFLADGTPLKVDFVVEIEEFND